MKLFRSYFRYFVLGLILAALVFGSFKAIRATQTEQTPCEQRTTPRCIYSYKKGQLGECPQLIEPCSLDAVKGQG